MPSKTEQAFIEQHPAFMGGSNQTSGSNYNFLLHFVFYYDPAVAKIVLSNYLIYRLH